MIGLRKRPPSVPFLLACLALVATARAQPERPASTRPATRATQGLEEADVSAAVRPLVEGEWCAGVAVGVIDAKGTRVFGYGKATDDRAPDGHTVYEIGSVSKTFTSLLLAEVVVDKQVALDDPVRQYLPDSVVLPACPGTGKAGPTTQPAKAITLLHLATHTSGLPPMPDNFKPKDPTNPYADYTVEQLYAFLSKCDLQHDPGGKYEYSNLGAGLLGHVLSRKAGEPYEKLLVRRICDPLGMNDTRITLDADQRKRLPPGHDADETPAANWDLPTLAGAGAIRSTADDMLKYVAAQIGLAAPRAAAPRAAAHIDPAMADAISLTHVPRADVPGIPDTRIALAWHIDTRHGVYWHNGQTGGYHSFVAFSPEHKVGVVLLTNTATGVLDAAGNRLILQAIGEPAEPLKLPPIVKLEPKVLDRYVGQYVMLPGLVLSVTRDGGRLYAQLTGQPKFGIYPTAQREFFWKVVPARVTFATGDDGEATRLVLHQNGRDIPALRLRTDTRPGTRPATEDDPSR